MAAEKKYYGEKKFKNVLTQYMHCSTLKNMERKRPKVVRIPCELMSEVKKAARLSGMPCSRLIRMAIEAKLPEYEACRPTNDSANAFSDRQEI